MTIAEENYALQSLYFEIPGEPSVLVEVTETDTGDLKFTLCVDPDAENTADLRGLFFDIGDEGLLDGLSISDGTHHSDDKIGDDSVTNLGGGCNVNGVEADEGGFDIGVEFGTSGMAKDDIQLTEFVLSHDFIDLSLADIENMEFAARLTSVGTEEDGRDGSLKLSTTAPEAEVLNEEEPVDPVQPPVDEEQALLQDVEQPTDGYTDPIDVTAEEEFPLPFVDIEEGGSDPYYDEGGDPLGDEIMLG